MDCKLYVTRWLLTVLLTGSYAWSSAAVLLVWPDSQDGKWHRIDIQKKILEVETEPDNWQTVGAVRLINVDAAAFPPVTRVTCLPIDKDRFYYLVVDCTQQVYRFDRQARTLERLDKTFFRGFNCFSVKFIRQDTLYSFGGYGFWHTNNILTYYKSFNHEWESINASADGPRSVFHGFNGYLPNNDSFFSALSFYQNDSENKGAFSYSDTVYSYSFKTKNWERLGKLTAKVRQQLPADFFQAGDWFQVGHYFVFKHYLPPNIHFFIVDPLHNEVRIWQDTHKLLANTADNVDASLPPGHALNDTLYFRRPVSSATGKSLQILRFSIADLWKDGVVIGAFYEPIDREDHSTLYSLLAVLFVLGSGGMAYRYKRSINTHVDGTELPSVNVYPTSLNAKELDVLQALAKTDSVNGINVERLNEILQITDKALENQRKIRADVIKGLNLKLKLEWGIDEAVERVPTALDQRMFTYVLKPEVRSRILVS